MSSAGAEMSEYETQAWEDLNGFWRRKSERRTLPPKMSKAMEVTSDKATDLAITTGGFISGITPQPVKEAGSIVLDWSYGPTVRAVVGLIEGVTEVVQKYTDVEGVFEYHRAKGREVDSLADLRRLDLEQLDALTSSLGMRSWLVGLTEGGVMGALTFVPVAGSLAAIPADLVVMHALSTAIATRAAYAYGIDATSEAERHHLDRMLGKAWMAQAPKAKTVKDARDTFRAGAGRVRWSEKFRNDHRIARATENLLKQVGDGTHVPIEKVVSKMPALAVVTAAGVNSTVLASLAKTSVRYSQTIHLSKKYGLALPPNLA